MTERETRTNRVTVVMSTPLKTTIQDLADEHERSVSDFIRLVLKEYVEALEERATEEVVEDEEDAE